MPYNNADFVFLPISRGEEKDKVIKKLIRLKQDGIEFVSGIDPDKKIWDQYAIQYIPKNFIVDKKGIIRYISTGNKEGSVDEISEQIKKLLNE